MKRKLTENLKNLIRDRRNVSLKIISDIDKTMKEGDTNKKKKYGYPM
jgi:hypothetical protein